MQINKTYIFDYHSYDPFKEDGLICISGRSFEWIMERYKLIGVVDVELSTDNFKYKGINYDWYELLQFKDKNLRAMFASAYFYNDGIKKGTVTELINNTKCPACGYIDYDSWEQNSGEYVCPQCKSISELERGYYEPVDCYPYTENRLTLKKIVKPKDVKQLKSEVCLN